MCLLKGTSLSHYAYRGQRAYGRSQVCVFTMKIQRSNVNTQTFIPICLPSPKSFYWSTSLQKSSNHDVRHISWESYKHTGSGAAKDLPHGSETTAPEHPQAGCGRYLGTLIYIFNSIGIMNYLLFLIQIFNIVLLWILFIESSVCLHCFSAYIMPLMVQNT